MMKDLTLKLEKMVVFVVTFCFISRIAFMLMQNLLTIGDLQHQRPQFFIKADTALKKSLRLQ